MLIYGKNHHNIVIILQLKKTNFKQSAFTIKTKIFIYKKILISAMKHP